MKKFWLAGTIAAFTLTGPSQAQVQPKPAPKKVGWVVDWGAQRCSLVRQFEGDQPVVMVLRTSLGTLRPELFLIGQWKVSPLGSKRTADVVLGPAGSRFSGPAIAGSTKSGRMVLITGLGAQFYETYGDASRMTVHVGNKTLVDVAVPGAKAAMKAVEDCNNDLLTSWGLDLKARASLQRMPQPIEGVKWISSDDYPAEAMRKEQQGTVVARFTVGPDGAVRDCVTVVASGAPALDRQTCIALSRRKFAPALAADGKPTSVKLIETLRWIIPGGDEGSYLLSTGMGAGSMTGVAN